MAVRGLLIFAFFIISYSGISRAQDTATSSGPNPVLEKQLEVAMGIDVVEKVDFDYSTKMTIGSDQMLRLVLVPQKREIIFKGQKPGTTTVIIRDNLGDVRLRYTVQITATGKSNTVSELRELIGDVEGLEIGIRGGKVFIGGEIVVPDDIGRVTKVLASYTEVLSLIELSPQTQRVIARKMSDELAKNNLKDVTVRVVNKTYWLEGVVGSADKKTLAMNIAKAYLPPKITSLSEQSGRSSTDENKPVILDFIAVNEKKEPQPPPKMVKVTAQFVELSKNYGKIFSFQWAPLMGADESEIRFGQTESGNVTSTSSGTLSATIRNLFPKLNAAKSAGYARVIQSGMVIVENDKGATLQRSTNTPFAVGSGDFTKAAEARVGFNLALKKALILEQEKVSLDFTLTVSLSVGTSDRITTDNVVTTIVIIKSKESAAIGGVVQNQSTTEYDKPDQNQASGQANGQPASPLFNLIRSKNYSTSKSQYVMFMTPEIIESASTGTEEIRKKFRRRE